MKPEACLIDFLPRRFFNGLGSDLNVTVGDLPNVTVGDLNFGVVGANNMSAYVMFPQGA